MPNISYYIHKEGLETYNDLIKICIMLLAFIIQNREIEIMDYNCMYIHNNLNDQLNYTISTIPCKLFSKHFFCSYI